MTMLFVSAVCDICDPPKGNAGVFDRDAFLRSQGLVGKKFVMNDPNPDLIMWVSETNPRAIITVNSARGLPLANQDYKRWVVVQFLPSVWKGVKSHCTQTFPRLSLVGGNSDTASIFTDAEYSKFMAKGYP